jgi:hypothetical protein
MLKSTISKKRRVRRKKRRVRRKKRRVRRARSITVPLSADIALGDTIDDYVRRVKTSKATAYRQMADGSLRYVMVRKQRRIPHTEYVRMGLVPAE